MPNLELIDLKGMSKGRGAWSADRRTGCCSGIFCFHSSMLHVHDDGSIHFPIPMTLEDDDGVRCSTVLIGPIESTDAWKYLLIDSETKSLALQKLAKLALRDALAMGLRVYHREHFDSDGIPAILLRQARTANDFPEKHEYNETIEAAVNDLNIAASVSDWKTALKNWAEEAHRMLSDDGSYGLIEQPINVFLRSLGFKFVCDKSERYPSRNYGSIVLDQDLQKVSHIAPEH